MLSLLISASLVALSMGQCSFKNGDITAKWEVADGEIIIEIINNNIGNNQWTGVGFGSSMNNLDVVLFTIRNNKASMVTGYTNDYAPPILDNSPSVNPELIQYSAGNTLVAKFVRPLGASGPRNVDLSQCMTWNFMMGGNIEGEIGYHHRGYNSGEVCPEKCKKN